jgi:RimJ/RimL family protein N-acetyltransferase
MNASLTGRRIRLVPLRISHAPALDRALRDRWVTRFLPPRVRKESGRHFVVRVLREQRRGEGVPYAIIPLGGVRAVGQIRLMNWSPSEGLAEVGYWIRRTHWGQGLGTEAVQLVCQYGFQTMGLHRIEANVVVGNIGSRRVLEKVGFREEGRARDSARVGRKWFDVWRFGLLRGEVRDTSHFRRPLVPRVTQAVGSRTV